MLNTSFNASARNVHSQYGEDGIIEKVLQLLPCDKWCVEFGAWDGIHASNSHNIIKNHGYKAVLIEANKKKFDVLKNNLSSYGAIFLNRYVNFEGENKLDNLLRQTPIPFNFDFLSIDIDGCDYYILESLADYKPKLICIEYNPTIPNDVHFIQKKDFTVKQGASAQAIVNLAHRKGYELIASTHCNLFFLDNVFLPAIKRLEGFPLDQLRDDKDSKIHVFCGFDGTILTDKPVSLFWHNLSVDQGQLQALPRYIRQYPGDYDFLQKIAFGIFLIFRNPQELVGYLKCYLGRSRSNGSHRL